MINKYAYSIVVLFDEDYDGFGQYIHSLDKIFYSMEMNYEIIIISNGKEKRIRQELIKIDVHGKLKAFALNKNTKQTVCLNSGFSECNGDVIMVCGSYKQLTDNSIYELIKNFDNDTDIISPWRKNRVDSWLSQLQSKMFNVLTQKITGSELHDLSCTVKIFRRWVLEEIVLYGNMYRFLPVLAAKEGVKTKEVKCEHYQERGKTGLYSISEYLNRIIDIFTLFFNIRFGKKPLRFFSILGSSFASLGTAALLYVGIQKMIFGYPIGGRPVLLLALLFIVFGIQIASIGLIGEIITFTHGRSRKEYNIEKKI